MSDSLAITFTEYEKDPSGQDTYVSLELSVKSRPFAGRSNCVVLERDLIVFLDDLDELAASSEGGATLVGGWGESAYVRLQFRPRGSLGHLEASVMLREHQAESDFRVEGNLLRDPAQVGTFSARMRDATTMQTYDEVTL